MMTVAAFLLCACAGAVVVIGIQFGALWELSSKRNAAEDDRDRAQAEADELQVQLNAALSRLSRKPKAGAR